MNSNAKLIQITLLLFKKNVDAHVSRSALDYQRSALPSIFL